MPVIGGDTSSVTGRLASRPLTDRIPMGAPPSMLVARCHTPQTCADAFRILQTLAPL
ncbi:hypothetical protein [Polyangium sp. y55x31]|uniref:hypothetical protein n=1 Tax=Polyangium sp. y55x31 TaxID=3042688 RepID=UPI0024821B56|nr:hypothetical protein [Polyangium sp. y55x31]MDI1483424.1 hypothetical protein [Polyangium sp. y55x31]